MVDLKGDPRISFLIGSILVVLRRSTPSTRVTKVVSRSVLTVLNEVHLLAFKEKRQPCYSMEPGTSLLVHELNLIEECMVQSSTFDLQNHILPQDSEVRTANPSGSSIEGSRLSFVLDFTRIE